MSESGVRVLSPRAAVGTHPFTSQTGSDEKNSPAWKKMTLACNSTRDLTASSGSEEAHRVPLDDAELLRRAAQGHEAAFRELADRHARYLYGIAFSLSGNAADAEDLVQ